MTSLDFPLRAAFVALPLEDEAKNAFGELQERLKEYASILRFQNAASPHLTLQYWSELMQIEYEPMIRGCEKIAAVTQPFLSGSTAPIRSAHAATIGRSSSP